MKKLTIALLIAFSFASFAQQKSYSTKIFGKITLEKFPNHYFKSKPTKTTTYKNRYTGKLEFIEQVNNLGQTTGFKIEMFNDGVSVNQATYFYKGEPVYSARFFPGSNKAEIITNYNLTSDKEGPQIYRTLKSSGGYTEKIEFIKDEAPLVDVTAKYLKYFDKNQKYIIATDKDGNYINKDDEDKYLSVSRGTYYHLQNETYLIPIEDADKYIKDKNGNFIVNKSKYDSNCCNGGLIRIEDKDLYLKNNNGEYFYNIADQDGDGFFIPISDGYKYVQNADGSYASVVEEDLMYRKKETTTPILKK